MTGASGSGPARRVLAAGVYPAGGESHVREMVEELGRTGRWSVEQRWIALGPSPVPPALAAVTVAAVTAPRPRFELLGGVLEPAGLEAFDYVLVCEPDVRLGHRFVDRYLELVERHDLALAQPARAHGGAVDPPIVEQMDGLDARQTRFVATGPVFSMRRDAARALLPFDAASPTGCGYDFVWPVVMEDAGLRMGIVDATPVAPAPRPPMAHHDLAAEQRRTKAFLDARPHVSRAEAFTILEAYA